MPEPRRPSARIASGAACIVAVGAIVAMACGGSLARHADAIAEPETRAEVRDALEELDRLRREGWLAAIRSGSCARTYATAPSESSGEVIGLLGAERIETTPAPCRAALDTIDRLRSVRTRIERESASHGVLEAFRRAVVEGRRADDACPTGGDDLRAMAIAIARHEFELTTARDVVYGVPTSLPSCRIPTLGGDVVVGHVRRVPIIHVRGARDLIEQRSDAPAAPQRETTATSYDFADDLATLGPSAPTTPPWRGARAVAVDVIGYGGPESASFDTYLLVRARDGWRVIDVVHVGES